MNAADPANARPFMHRFRSGVLRAPIAHPLKCLLLVLAEFADSEGGSCFPSIATLARFAGMNERTARRYLEHSCPWFERVGHAGMDGGRGWRTYGYVLRIPVGADTRPARWSLSHPDGAGTVSAPTGQRADNAPAPDGTTCGHSVRMVRTFTTDGADTVSDEVGFEIGKSKLEEKATAEAIATPADSRKKEKRSARRKGTTFDKWSSTLRDRDEDCIYSDDPIFEWAERAGIPRDFLGIAWTQFVERFSGSEKVQLDWRATFRNYVREGWLNCWRATSDGYVLTTVGEQARRIRDAQE